VAGPVPGSDVVVLSRKARSCETISAAPWKRPASLPAIRAWRCRDGWWAHRARAGAAPPAGCAPASGGSSVRRRGGRWGFQGRKLPRPRGPRMAGWVTGDWRVFGVRVVFFLEGHVVWVFEAREAAREAISDSRSLSETAAIRGRREASGPGQSPCPGPGIRCAQAWGAYERPSLRPAFRARPGCASGWSCRSRSGRRDRRVPRR
jgi:hypothetical protein